MKARIAMICGLLCAPVFAEPAPTPIQDILDSSVAVVDAAILGARTASYRYRGKSGVCGLIYEATVNESFKGDLTGTLVFASDQPLRPESRLLIFLRREDGLPHDKELERDKGESKARRACTATLPILRSDARHTGDFGISSHWPVIWNVRLSRWITPLPELEASTVEVLQARLDGLPRDESTWPGNMPPLADLFTRYSVVDWNRLRQWLLMRGKQQP